MHFWCYAQRLHQFRSLEEIGKMLAEALVNAADLKRFTEHLCNESYPLSDNLAEEVNELEQRWPCFKETDCVTQTTSVQWGDCRPGRIPSFVWEDAGPDYADAHTYEQRFARALQENLKCVQHHIHPKKGASQQRTIPNACLSTRSGKECKAGFPMDNRMNLDHPVLLCKGLAKKRCLPWRGRRR